MDLEFKQIEGNLPVTGCCNCGQSLTTQGFIADVDVNDNEAVSFIVCSEGCMEHFKGHPCADAYIHQTIEKVKSLSVL
jgi:hypothetical protein